MCPHATNNTQRKQQRRQQQLNALSRASTTNTNIYLNDSAHAEFARASTTRDLRNVIKSRARKRNKKKKEDIPLRRQRRRRQHRVGNIASEPCPISSDLSRCGSIAAAPLPPPRRRRCRRRSSYAARCRFDRCRCGAFIRAACL